MGHAASDTAKVLSQERRPVAYADFPAVAKLLALPDSTLRLSPDLYSARCIHAAARRRSSRVHARRANQSDPLVLVRCDASPDTATEINPGQPR